MSGLEGVVANAAKVHAVAWKTLFDEYLKDKMSVTGGAGEPFDKETDYHDYIAGKPVYEGVASFLESRGIDLPHGTPGDPANVETICGLENRKNQIFAKYLETHGVEVDKTAVEFFHLLKENGFRTAVVSFGEDCRAILEAAGVDGLFDVQVDCVASEQSGLKGAPWPDTFLEAARRLNVSPERALVLAEAVPDVQAGRRGKFGAVLGVNGSVNAGALKENGADVVVNTHSELTVEGKRPICMNTVEALPSALSSMDKIKEKVTAKRLFVALDYDGTLTPIVEHPDLAILSDEMRSAVAALAKHCTVAVVSGRDRKNVETLVGIDGLSYAGSHGFDISGPAGRLISGEQGTRFLPVLNSAEKSIRGYLEQFEGALVERKKFSIAVHYRKVEKGRKHEVEAAVDRVLAAHSGLRKGSGKKVFQLQPEIDWHKGKALCWLMDALDLDRPDVLPLYMGDDVTDEDAFRVLQDGGIGVLVKGEDVEETPQYSAARYVLDDCRQVRDFLTDLTELLQGGPK